MSSLCPMKMGGCHGFWMGLAAGALLTYAHATLWNSSSNSDNDKRTSRRTPIRAAGNKAWRMSKWVQHGGVLYTQGLCGDFAKMPASSVAQQTAEALAQLDQILAAAKLQRKNLLTVTIYLADMKEFDEMNKVYDQWVDPAGLPTRLCVQAQMGHGAKVEIRAQAYYDQDDDE